jgi:hypothetical protein
MLTWLDGWLDGGWLGVGWPGLGQLRSSRLPAMSFLNAASALGGSPGGGVTKKGRTLK